MKVLMLDGAGFSPPYDFSLARGLEGAGAEVRLVMPPATRGQWEAPDAVPAPAGSRWSQAHGRIFRAISYVALLEETRREIEHWKPDVVHVQWLPLPMVDDRLLRSLQSRVPLVHTLHNTSRSFDGWGGVQAWGLRNTLRSFDRVIVHSEYSRASALKLELATDERIHVIPHGAFDYYRRYAAEVVRGEQPIRLLFAGSIKRYKALDVLIDALPVLADHTPTGSWHLTIAGHPSMAVDSLVAAVSACGLSEHVSWSLRHQSERELGRLLSAADVVVLPYREIDQSGVLLAAVGVERAVVASRVGAFPELIDHERHGLLVPPEAPKELGLALARLVADGGLRSYCEQQMGLLARSTLHWATIGHATLDLYRKIVQS